jgi:large subunit ribosomal protein L10
LEQKKQAVAALASTLTNSVAGVLVDYRGITVEQDTQLRRDLRAAGVQYSVVKNTLLRRATAETGLTALDDQLVGTTALAVSPDDHTAAARILNAFIEKSKSKTFVLKGGYLDGKVIDVKTVENLAKLPTRDVLLGSVANVFQAPIAALARVLQAVVDKEPAVAEAPQEEVAPAVEAPAEEASAPAEAPAEETAAPAAE